MCHARALQMYRVHVQWVGQPAAGQTRFVCSSEFGIGGTYVIVLLVSII